MYILQYALAQWVAMHCLLYTSEDYAVWLAKRERTA